MSKSWSLIFGGPFGAKMANQQALSSSRLQSGGSKAAQRSPDRSVAHLGAVFGRSTMESCNFEGPFWHVWANLWTLWTISSI